jgi:hypothetical protein
LKKTKLLLLFFLILVSSAYSQFNKNLSQQIDSLVIEDQKWRLLEVQVENKEIDTLNVDFLIKKIGETDSLNFIIIKQIFEDYGFPGYDKVGGLSSQNFFLLVQHSDRHPEFQDSVLIKMKIEVDRNNASSMDYSYLVDRVKINSNQLQVYGTQLELNSSETSFEPLPVIEPENLNERRKSVGLPPIEEYIKAVNEFYRGKLK